MDLARARTLLLLALALAPLALAAPIAAQELPQGTEAEESQPPDVFYIPYEDLQEVLAREPRGVLLPYDEFQRLWEAARGPRPAEGSRYLLGESRYEGTVDPGASDGPAVVRLAGTLEIDVTGDGWQTVALPFIGASVVDASVEAPAGQRGLLGIPLATPGAPPPAPGIALAVSGAGHYRLRVSLAAAASGDEEKTADLGVPPAPLTRVELAVPGERARPEVTGAAAQTRVVEGGRSIVRAFLPPDGRIRLRWTAAPRETAPREAQIGATLALGIEIRPDRLVLDLDASFEVSRAETDTFRLAIPEGWSVIDVTGDRIAETTVATDPTYGRLLVARTQSPRTGTVSFRARLEAARATPGEAFVVPPLRAPDARSETGWVAVRAATGLRAEVAELSGASRVEPGSLPERIRPLALHAFRYLTLPYTIRFAVEVLEPRVTVSARHQAAFGTDRLRVASAYDIQVEDAPIFRVDLTAPPAGFVLDRVAVVTGSTLRRHRVEGDRLIIELDRPIPPGTPSHIEVDLHLDRTAETPPAVEMPLLAVLGAAVEQGICGVGAIPSLDLVVDRSDGLSPEDPRTVPIPQGFVEGGPEARLAFRYAARPVTLGITVRPKPPRVQARVLRAVHVRPGVVEDQIDVVLTIEFAPIPSITLAFPAALAGEEMHVEGVPVAEVRDRTEGENLLKEIRFQTPLQGTQTVRVRRQQTLTEVAPGEGTDVAVAACAVRDVFSETGQIAVSAAESLVIVVGPDATAGLRQIDARELAAELQETGERAPVKAFEYTEPGARLGFTVFRYQYAEMLRVFVEAFHVETEVSTQDPWEARSEMFAVLQQNRVPNVVLVLPPGSRLDQILVDGQMVAPAPMEGDRYLVNLARGGGARTGSLWLSARFNTPLGDSMGSFGRIDLVPPSLELRDEVPGARFTWRIYVPTGEYEVLSITTDLRRLFERPTWWEWLREIILGRDTGWPQADAALLEAAAGARQRAASAGFHFQLLPSGEAFPFGSPGRPAPVYIRYAGTKTYYVLDFLVFLGVAAAGGGLILRSRKWDASSKAGLALGFPLGVLALATILPEGVAAFAGAAFIATGAVVICGVAAFFALDLPERLAAARAAAIVKLTMAAPAAPPAAPGTPDAPKGGEGRA